MGFNGEIIALTSFFNGEIIALIARCRQNKIKKLLCFMKSDFGWLVGDFGFNGPLKHYFSLYQAVCQREGERAQKG